MKFPKLQKRAMPGVAYDKLKYARYISPYYAQMTNLPEKNPRVYEAFLGIIVTRLESHCSRNVELEPGRSWLT